MARSRSARPAPDADGVPLAEAQRDVFARFLPKAALVLLDRVRVFRVLRRSLARLNAEGGMARVKDDGRSLVRFVAAFASGEYTDVPWRSAVYALGALLYFLSPIDLVPDFIPVLGFTDDVAVVLAVVSAIRRDLSRFERWRTGAGTAGRVAPEAGAFDEAQIVSGDGAPRRPRVH